MAEFLSSGEFGKTSGPNEIAEEKQGFQMGVQSDSNSKEEQVVEVHMSKNDFGSIDKPVQMSNAVSDGISLDGVDVSLNFDNMVENHGEGAHVSVQHEQIGDGIFLDGMDVTLTFEDASGNHGEGAHVIMQGEQPGEKQGGGANVSVQNEEPGRKEKADSEGGLGSVKVGQNVEAKVDVVDPSQIDGVHISLVEQVEELHNDVLKNCGNIEENEREACDTRVSPNAQSIPSPEETNEKVRVVVLALPVNDASETPRRGRKPVNAADANETPRPGRKPVNAADDSETPRRGRPVNAAANSMKKNSIEQLSVDGPRALRSRCKENPKDPEPSVNLETSKGRTGRRGKKKSKEKDGKPDDEFSRIKKHLKYQLHRMHFEQNLLDAYSLEGWRGQSVEKLRPEKELQRAKADINRSKLKIRNLFQKIDSMSAEGKFPESLYDSDGLIDSEDIFCAKCGSKELPVGNDIILCDGICERGFHQYCLDPPLKTEEIPPGDEGWLCPSCDCKHDCIDFINDYQGTKLSIEDSWEKVFPEAVSGKELDDVMGLPSDDSEDDEYNPGATDDDANVEGNESSSDDSDSEKSDSSEFSSVSEDLGAICGAEQNLGLPSDDSEDDDFDPDAKNVNEEGIEHESSSSDFTSASEDLGAAIGDDGASDKDEPPQPMALEQDLGESSPITSKRCVERLDYKKLYDETYGDDTLESSDDEEWEDMVPTRKRKGSTEKSVSPSSLGASASADGTCGSGAPRRRGRPKANLQVANGSPVQLQESSQKTTSGGSGRKRPPYSRLGEAVTQRLYASFKENQYPDREAKEKLANELGLTAHRVDKWFGNARWSFHHHPSRVEASISRAVSQSNTNSVACNGDESALASDAAALPECGSTDTTKSPNSQKHAPRNSRKNNKEGNQPMLETTNTENSTEGTQNTTEGTQTDPLHTPDTSQGRKQRKRRKLGA